ncbi:MAG: spermatogenesis-associated protein 2 [Candidatus Syntropharchaeia archaeon]
MTKCGDCNENEATQECAECGKPLCEMCAEEVTMEDMSPAHRIKGISTPGPTGPAVRKKIVCKECLRDIDIF